MKKIYTILSLILSFGTIFAQSIPFIGTGTLTANGWTTHSGTTGQMVIISTPSDNGNSLSYTGLADSSGNRTAMVAGNTEDVNFPFTTPFTTGDVYFSALIKVLDASVLDSNATTGSYGLSLTSVASASTTVFQARIYTKQGTTPGTFLLGVLNNSGGGAAPIFSSSNYTVNTTHLVVVKYNFTTNAAILIVDPTVGSPEPTTPTASSATGTTLAPTQIAGFVIRQAGTLTAGSGNIEVDEIRIGTTYATVTPSNLSTKQNDIVGLDIYPNPVTGNVLNIKTAANDTKTINIFDVLGKQVLNLTTESATVNVSNLNAGIYILKVTEDGKTATRKLMIK